MGRRLNLISALNWCRYYGTPFAQHRPPLRLNMIQLYTPALHPRFGGTLIIARYRKRLQVIHSAVPRIFQRILFCREA